MQVRGLRGNRKLDWIAGFGAGCSNKIDDVVIDHYGGHQDVGAAFAAGLWQKRGVHVDVSVDPANAFCSDLRGELLDDGERISGKRGAAIRVVFINEGEGAIGLNAVGKIWVATGDEDEVAFERAVLVDRSGAEDVRVEAEVRAQFREQGTFGEDFGGGRGNEQLIGVERVEDLAAVERVELDAEIGVSKFGAGDDSLDALRQGIFGLRLGRESLKGENDREKRNGKERQTTRSIFQNRVLQAMIQVLP